MKLFRIFSIGADRILAKGCSVKGTVTMARKSAILVVKKPVRIVNNESNTRYSHMITFRYSVDAVTYTGKLFVPVQYRCPQKGEKIDVYYDPAKPQNYALCAFGPAPRPIGW